MARNSNSDARKARSVTIKYNRDGTKTRLLNGKLILLLNQEQGVLVSQLKQVIY